MIEEKDANVVEDAARKSRTPRYVIRMRTLKLLHDLVEVYAPSGSPEGYVRHGNRIAMCEASEAAEAYCLIPRHENDWRPGHGDPKESRVNN